MQGERRVDRGALQDEYGIGRRLAARIVALLARSVEVTPSLLELATPGSPVEALLLRNEWLQTPETLGVEALARAAAECGVPGDLLLTVETGGDGRRVIGLEDDRIAAEIEQGGRSGGIGGLELVQAGSGAAALADAGRIFTPEDVAHLKLIALTSQNPGDRIEAIRKLVYTRLPVGEKASVFVQVLVDPLCDARVREEASRCLEQLGFRADLAEGLRGLFSSVEAVALQSIERIGLLMDKADAAERAVTLTVVLELFDECKSSAMQARMIRVAERHADDLVKNAFRLEQFVRAAIRHLAGSFRDLALPVESALARLAAAEPAAVAALIWRELESAGSPAIRAFLLLAAAGAQGSDSERTAEVARRMVAEILDPSLNERLRARLRFALGRLGNPAVTTIIAEIPGARPVQKPELIRLLDVICTEGALDREHFRSAVRAVLDQLKVADRQTRRTVLECRVCADARVEPALRQELASEFVAHLPEFRLPDTRDAIRFVLRSIGRDAAGAILGFVRRRFPDEDSDELLRTLGDIVADHGDDVDEERLREAIEFCLQAFGRDDVSRGGFVFALARICGHTRIGAERFEEVLRLQLGALWKSPYTYDMIEALGIMGGSPNARPEHQEELADMLLRLLRLTPPEDIGRRRDTEEGAVYEFGPEIDFDTLVIPSAVRGLERIVISGQATFEIRERIVKQFLVLWEGISNVRIVWSPAGVDALIAAMSSAARYEMIPVEVRIRLGRSLLHYVGRASVIRALGAVAAQTDRSGQMEPFALEVAHTLIDEWGQCDRQDDDRKKALLQGIARIAANTSLSARRKSVRQMRESALQALFQGLRENIPDAMDALALIRDCPDYPEQDREEVRRRLQQFMGLARTDNWMWYR